MVFGNWAVKCFDLGKLLCDDRVPNERDRSRELNHSTTNFYCCWSALVTVWENLTPWQHFHMMYILLCFYSSSSHALSLHAASALEVSTSLPRSSNSFWQLALSAESSPAQVLCWSGDIIMYSCGLHHIIVVCIQYQYLMYLDHSVKDCSQL